MNIRELQEVLEYAREQMFHAELRLDQLTDPELIDACIYEIRAWEMRFGYYNRKLKEAVASGQAIPCRRYVQFGGRR